MKISVAAAAFKNFPMESFDMSAKLEEKGGLPNNVKRIRLYFICNAKVAKVVLGAQPKLSAIMPCTWSVYELDDGSVWGFVDTHSHIFSNAAFGGGGRPFGARGLG